MKYPHLESGISPLVAFCGNAREYPFGFVRLEGAKAALFKPQSKPLLKGPRNRHRNKSGYQGISCNWLS